MNVIISNRLKSITSTLDIDVIKVLDGEFEVEEIIKSFSNFYFQRMILDITAIKGYSDIRNLQKLSIGLDIDRIILVIPDDDTSTSPSNLSKIISMGIYNFARDKEGIMYLYNHPNTYRDVAHIHQLDGASQTVQSGPGVVYKNNVTPQTQIKYVTNTIDNTKIQKVIGFKNVTEHAGSTSLVYMLYNTLKKHYATACIEINKSDFLYYDQKDMHSSTSSTLGNKLIELKDKEVILIDFNDYSDTSMCDYMIYLFEPSVIKINKLTKRGIKYINSYSDKTVVLNKSLLNPKDVLDFEYETKTKIFYSIPPLDDRNDNNQPLNVFLKKIGFNKIDVNGGESNKFLKIFKF